MTAAEFNERYRKGAAVDVARLGRRPLFTVTRSAAWTIATCPVVLVERIVGPVRLADLTAIDGEIDFRAATAAEPTEVPAP